MKPVERQRVARKKACHFRHRVLRSIDVSELLDPRPKVGLVGSAGSLEARLLVGVSDLAGREYTFWRGSKLQCAHLDLFEVVGGRLSGVLGVFSVVSDTSNTVKSGGPYFYWLISTSVSFAYVACVQVVGGDVVVEGGRWLEWPHGARRPVVYQVHTLAKLSGVRFSLCSPDVGVEVARWVRERFDDIRYI